jgi:hypothetical protein
MISYKPHYEKLTSNGIRICKESDDFSKANNLNLYTIEIRLGKFFYGTYLKFK